jgi:murein DD-endopeptidase MepM/ murein hydrolase activator NlpD
MLRRNRLELSGRIGRRQERSRSARLVALLLMVALVGVFLWAGLRRGPAPVIVLETQHAAIGRANRVTARFTDASAGLGTVRLELVQGDRVELLAERHFQRPGAFAFGRGARTSTALVDSVVGSERQPWLREGEAVLRASADRMTGPLRPRSVVTVDSTMKVRLRPPQLQVLSQQHYVRQGGSGVVIFQVGDSAARSGVRTGAVESLSYALASSSGQRFCLFGVPWNLTDRGQIRLFAEDDAGNRVELPFVDEFKASPPRPATIEISGDFLARVVPAIASQTPGFDARGTLLEQYLRLNGEYRRAALAQLVELGRRSEPRRLWRGAFAQMPKTARRAGFAEDRSYVYSGRTVDRQTHLGLDLAATAHAPVPAANDGRVVFAGWIPIYGNTVVVDHGFGLQSLYGHMSALAVHGGEVVHKGEVLGASGATGLAGGDHLHLELLVQGTSVTPLEWLDEHWIHDNIERKLTLPGS